MNDRLGIRGRVAIFAILVVVASGAAAMSAAADPGPSSVQLTVSNSAPLYLTVVTLQALVTGTGIPTGTVTFLDGTTTIGTAILDATGAAQMTTAALAVGPHSITVAYAGDAANAPSVSDPTTVTVFEKSHTDLLAYTQPKGLISTPTTPIVFVANVINAAPIGTKRAVTGTVTFTVDGVKTTLPVVGLHHANLLFPNGMGLGPHVATAHYNGDATYAPSTSPTRTIKVQRNLTTVIVGSPDPVVAGANLTYTVTVTNNGLASAANVQAVDTLPTGATLVSATAVGGCTGTGPVTCTLGTLAILHSAVATIVVQTPATPPDDGVLTDTATALAGMNPVATATTSIVAGP
jgi:uncharacterized repeat protein (TIGR01451 family)